MTEKPYTLKEFAEDAKKHDICIDRIISALEELQGIGIEVLGSWDREDLASVFTLTQSALLFTEVKDEQDTLFTCAKILLGAIKKYRLTL